MHLQRFSSASAFLAAAQPFLLEAESENNLILGLAGDLAAGRGPADGAKYFATIHDGDRICLSAFSTVPDKVGLTRATDPAALSLLVADVIEACPAMQVVLGPEPTTRAFADLVAAQLGTSPHLWMSQRIHELRQVEPLPNLPAGHLRLAGIGDLDLMSDWVAGFLEHSGERGNPRELAEDRIARGLLYVWEDREPVSMAAWTGRTPNGVRINFVYTPLPLRGRGYATACVAALSRRMLETSRFCCLYTDLANPTSNAIYYRIGYRPVCDAAVYSIR